MKKLITIIAIFILSLAPVFADYTVTVKVKDAWTQTKETETCKKTNCRYDGSTLRCDTVCTTKTETIHHPAQYKTYTISGAVSPQQINDIINGINEGSDTEITVENIEEVPAALGQDAADAGNIIDGADSFREQVQQDSQQAANTTTETEEIKNGTVGGDPVLFATGDFVTSSTDLSFSMVGTSVEVMRNYQAAHSEAHAFGPGWIFNYDTRIVRGIKPRSYEDVEYVTQKRDELQNLYDQAEQQYQNSLSVLNNTSLYRCQISTENSCQ